MIALLLAAVLSIPYPQPTDLTDLAPPDDCADYLGGSCKNWKLATWLPELGPPLGIAQHAATVTFTDRFVSDESTPNDVPLVASQGSPAVGTPFSYGKAGPPHGVAMYDAQHRIAFYGQGCCAWHSDVLAAGVEPPPIPVEARLLTGIRTQRGLYLGMTTQQALRLYGNASVVDANGVPGVVTRSYQHKMPPPASPTCEEAMTLGFYLDRLIYIGITQAC
jgi:hypothetical protein